MENQGTRLNRIGNLALLLAMLSFLVVLASAYIRLSGAGLGCAGWPECYGQILVGGPHAHTDVARILHRLVASCALLLGVYLAWQCLRPKSLQSLASYASALVTLMILLTLVGVWSADPHRVWASFVNMLGGAALVALSWLFYLKVENQAKHQADHVRGARSDGLLLPGILALVLSVVLGALISARYAVVSCTTTPDCSGVWWPASGAWAAINPFAGVATASPQGESGGVALHLLHRYSSVAAMLLLGMVGLRALLVDASRRVAAVMLTLLAVEFALGSITVLSGFSLWLAIGHSAMSAALLAAALQLRLQVTAG